MKSILSVIFVLFATTLTAMPIQFVSDPKQHVTQSVTQSSGLDQQPALQAKKLNSSHSSKTKLTLEECIKQALESNYAIKIAANARDIAENNKTLAPFLPVIMANGVQSQSKNHSTVIFSADDRKTTTNNTVDNVSANANFKWRLFDGLSMFATYDRTRQMLKDGELRLKGSMETLVANISNQYYATVIQQRRVKTSEQYVEISQQRYSQALEKYNIGAISGLEMKQAKIDLNADSSQLITDKDQLRNHYIALYEMINTNLGGDFELDADISPNPSLELDKLTDYAMQNNTSINLSKIGGAIAQSDLRSARALRYPTLDFTTGYNYSQNQNPFAVTKYNNTNGYNWGFSMSLNIFNGLETNRKIKNAKILLQSADYTTEQAKLMVNSELLRTYNSYVSNLQMIAFEQENSQVAMSNLDAALDMYRLGTLSGVEFREIQRSYLSAEIRKLAAIYQAKVSEISLLYLSGALLTDLF